ncbi:MAG: Ca2+-binding RTX toxin-like protein, partial [Pirellulaceae bacterium]
LAGGFGIDILFGGTGPGNDFIRGNSGEDVLYGGEGSDQLYGDDDVDHLYNGSSGFETPTDLILQATITDQPSWDAVFAPLFAGLVTLRDNWTNPGPHTDDGDVDVLSGGAGLDVFFAAAGDLVTQ